MQLVRFVKCAAPSVVDVIITQFERSFACRVACLLGRTRLMTELDMDNRRIFEGWRSDGVERYEFDEDNVTPLSGTRPKLGGVGGGVDDAGGGLGVADGSTFERDLNENFCFGARSFLTFASSSARFLSCYDKFELQ
jgi:hypothetical protein